MAPVEQTHSASRIQMPVLLIIIGGLGDWCIRRVLKHAKEYEEKSGRTATVVVVDIHPQENIDQWIARRLIEQSAEDVDLPPRDASGRPPKGIAWGFTERLADDPKLPDPTVDASAPDQAIREFEEKLGDDFDAASKENRPTLQAVVEPKMRGYLADTEKQFLENPEITINELALRWKLNRDIKSFSEIKDALVKFLVDQVIKLAHDTKKRLYDERETLNQWLQQIVSISRQDVRRYRRFDPASKLLYQHSSSNSKVTVPDEMLQQFAKEYRIIVYVATPPEAYPGILKQWSAYAERIALEKPIAGLLESVE